jgi:sugar phosphate isomerase/epimerase
MKNLRSSGQNITIFSKHLHWLDLKEMAETAASMGFDGIDLTIRPNGHVEPEKVEDQLPRAVEICKKVEIDIVMVCTTIQDISQSFTENILKTASELGIKYYRMDWYHYDKTIGIDENLENFLLKMQDLAGMNEHYKIKGAYQNHDGTWYGAPVWDLGVNLRKINSDWLGVQYDILNASIEGTNSWLLLLFTQLILKMQPGSKKMKNGTLTIFRSEMAMSTSKHSSIY